MDVSSPTFRRSSSLPPPKSAATSDPQVEVLFNLPSVRIVAFTTSSTTGRPELRNGGSAEEEQPGTLPWVSRFERTIAVGPLRIYRAPGSVAFLNCANALQPILPKSQSWCVDGTSKFVLQIRRPQYWRIEVPNKDADEKSRVEELKIVLSKVLLYEKTPCPFQRDFVVELPEAPQTPVVKRPWRPVQGPQPFSPNFEAKPLTDDDSRSYRASSPYARSRASSLQIRQRSPQRPPTPRHSPARPSNLSADVNAKLKSHELNQPSPPHSPMITPPPSSPATFVVERVLLATPPSRNVAPTSPPRTPISTPARLSPKATQIAQPLINALECLPSVVEESVETSDYDLRNVLAPSMLESVEDESAADAETEGPESDLLSESAGEENTTPKSVFQPDYQLPLPNMEEAERPQALRNTPRSTTSPPILSLITSPPSKQRPKSPLRNSAISQTDSNHSSSVESFHSMNSWHSPIESTSAGSQSSSPSPTYPYPHDNIVLPKRRPALKISVEPKTPGAWASPVGDCDDSSSMCLPRHQERPITDKAAVEISPDEQVEAVSPPVTGSSIRHRATTSSNSRRRELSPLPAAVNLFSPSRTGRPRRLQTARHIPTAIIQKTCEILLSPPSHLFTMMINIASKLAAGEWRGFLFSGYGEEVHWDFEDEYGRSSYSPEDDYGIALPRSNMPRKPKSKSNTNVSGSWEVD